MLRVWAICDLHPRGMAGHQRVTSGKDELIRPCLTLPARQGGGSSVTSRQLFPGQGCERLGQGTPPAAAALAPSGSSFPPLEPVKLEGNLCFSLDPQIPRAASMPLHTIQSRTAASHAGDGLSKKFARGVSVPGCGTCMPTKPPLLHLASAADAHGLCD